MLKNSKIKSIAFASILVLIIGFSHSYEARALELCPVGSFANGAITINVAPGVSDVDFVGGLLGTFESSGKGKVVGGIDWLYNKDNESSFETSSTAPQLIGYWNQDKRRNTFIQVTNTNQGSPVSLSIELLDENCLDPLSFCDTLSPGDTHVYNLGGIKVKEFKEPIMITNDGSVLVDNIQGHEGIFVVTPIIECGVDRRAIEFPFLHGDIRVIDDKNKFDYGAKMWARGANTSGCEDQTGGFNILDGTEYCKFRDVLPSKLSQVFSTISNPVNARSDIILFALTDSYSDDIYTPSSNSSFVTFNPAILDEDELSLSCLGETVCFARFGLNETIPISKKK